MIIRLYVALLPRYLIYGKDTEMIEPKNHLGRGKRCCTINPKNGYRLRVVSVRVLFEKDGDKANVVKIDNRFEYGSMSGKIWMSDDFDAPLDDFKEYME